MSSIFRAYDVRGKVPEEINGEVVKKIGRAFGQFLDVKKVAVGRDVRNHSLKLFQSFSQGLMETDKEVIDLGQVPTPVVAYWMRKKGLNGGAMITASHNPPEYNGIKFRGQAGKAFTWESGISHIKSLYEQLEVESDQEERNKKEEGRERLKPVEPLPHYVEDTADKVNLESSLKVVMDCSNGAAGLVAPKLFEKVGIETMTLNQKPDGNFPAHPPHPTDPKAIEAVESKVVATGADLGIIYDGDGDRALFVDERGELVSSGEVLMLLAADLMDGEGEEGKVIFDITMSEAVPEYIHSLGGEALVSRTGNSYFAEKIDQDPSILVGAESSGHIFLPAVGVPYDDGIFASLKFGAVVAQLDSLARAREKLPSYYTSEEKRITCPEERKEEIIALVKKQFEDRWESIFTIDGIKVMLDSGWFLLRPSNTEPKLSLRAEAETEAEMKAIRDEVMAEIKDNLD